MIRPVELDGIKAAPIDLGFRRWDRPRVVVGTRMRTAVGLIEVTAVEPVDETTITRTMRAGPAPRPSTRCGAAWADRPVFRVGLRGAGEDPRIALRQRPPTEADLAWPEAPPTTGTITSTAWARPSAALGVQVGQIANSLVFDADGAPLLVLTSETRTASEAPLRTLVDRDLERYVRGVGC